MMIAKPVHGTPALVLKIGRERVLVVTDLHLGAECELVTKGISLPSQVPRVLKRLTSLVKKTKARRLIMLGDVKHNIPVTSWQEWRELPGFFEYLSKHVQVEVIRGNHDGDLRGMVPESVKIHDVKGIVLGKRKRVGLMHGHAWPAPELFNTELLISGHNHPAVEFKDELGGKIIEPVWLRAELVQKKLPKKMQAAIKGKPPKLLVVPAFGALVGGAPVNREMPEELIGPLFKSGAVKLDAAQVYLLDGTFLGRVENLKTLEKNNKNPD